MNSPRHILVTGDTSGIGAGIARAFAAAGDSVTVTGATAAEVERFAADPPHAAIEARVLDVRDDADVRAAVDAVAGRSDRNPGGIDVIVNCAGVIRRGAEHDPAVFADTLDINLTDTMRVCTAARPWLKARAGCIVNTASMLSFFGGGLVPGYSASKGGVAQLTKSLAGHRLRGRRHPRQRRGTGLDRHTADASAAGRPGTQRPDRRAHAAGALGYTG
jgi:NAD(P)-dependent dehydrogenase (short-subunit alcohol dehydrogenase family)